MKTLIRSTCRGDVGALLESEPGRGFGAVADMSVLELDPGSSPAGITDKLLSTPPRLSLRTTVVTTASRCGFTGNQSLG